MPAGTGHHIRCQEYLSTLDQMSAMPDAMLVAHTHMYM